MLIPDYHTIHVEAQARIARCQREAQYSHDDVVNLRRSSAHVLRWLANRLEPHQPNSHTLAREVYAHE